MITVEILSADPWTDDQLQDLESVNAAISDGDSSGLVTTTVHNEQVDAATMSQLLLAQGSDPDFLLGYSTDEDADADAPQVG